ncbi:hypothetical protein LEN26_000831 [Aphanomyces euteiches]|nr:hypothetical protein LEN26_000831 [Aphanomyces euteiches]
MKKLFNLSLYPSKRKYEEQKQAVEVALQDIEKKRQRLLDAAVGGLSDEESEEESTDDYHDELMRCHQQKTRPNTSGMSDISIRPQTASLFTSGSGFETTLGLAMTMSLIPSTTMAESRQDIYSPKARTLETLKHKPSGPIMWMLKGVILMNFNSESKLVGSIELRTESTLEETRQLIKQFVPSLPKSYNFVQLPDCSVIDCSSEANLRTCLTYEDDIYIKELPVMESSDERLKRIQVKDRQQAAFEQFIQRQQNIKPFIAPAPQKGGPQHPQTKPEIAERTNVVLSPKHILYDAEHKYEGVDYQVIIQYEPFLGRITVRLKTIKTGSKSAKLSLNDIDFLNLIDATHDVSLHGKRFLYSQTTFP